MEILLEAQRNEITEYHVYRKLAERATTDTKKILLRIADEELKHYQMFKRITGRDVEPDQKKIFFYALAARVFGLTFAIRLMERGEEKVQRLYEGLATKYPLIKDILEEERIHERELEALVKDAVATHIGSIVLGLNDALVEMTGAIVGLSATLPDARSVFTSAFVVGIAAALSMAASEYLSKRAEGEGKPGQAALATGLTYFFVVLLLTAPFLLFDKTLALLFTLLFSLLIIGLAGFYVAIIHERDPRKEALTMAAASLGVALIAYLVGNLVKGF